MRRLAAACWVALALVERAAAGFTMEEEMAVHPDGTPVHPEKLRAKLRSGEVTPHDWMQDERLVELAVGEDIEAFTEYMQQINYDRMFHEDGSARDIVEWRQSVRDDAYYSGLLRDSFPEMFTLIDTGTNEEVQQMLVSQHQAQAAEVQRRRAREPVESWAAGMKGEL